MVANTSDRTRPLSSHGWRCMLPASMYVGEGPAEEVGQVKTFLLTIVVFSNDDNKKVYGVSM